jgi:amino acid transporter
MATIPAGEVRDPQKNLPLALLIAILVVAVLYILIQIVCVGTLQELAQSERPLADAGSRFLGPGGGAIISAGAIISISGNLNVLLLSGSRLPFAMSELRQLPSFISSVHRTFFTPYVAILITAGLMLFLTLNSSFVAALTISTIARLVTYGATCISLSVFRSRRETPAAAFRLPGGNVIAILSSLLIVVLLVSALKEVKATAIAAGVGLLIYLAYRTYSRRTPAERHL